MVNSNPGTRPTESGTTLKLEVMNLAEVSVDQYYKINKKLSKGDKLGKN